MSHPPELSEPLKGFSGRAPLFPLPSVAFFPHVLLPLHIFEPRYREMTADALDGDRFIALAQLRPEWEVWTGDLPPIFDYVCLGRITAEERLADGRYYLILQGLTRARVLSEESAGRSYRIGRLELRPDRALPAPLIDREIRRREILEAFRDLYPGAQLDKLLHEAVDATASLGLVCDVVASALRLQPEQTQEVLAEEDVDLRSDLVLARLKEQRRKKSQRAPVPKRFPPDFSEN